MFFRYLGLSGAIRFAVEGVRTNPAVALGLSEAQWTSLALMAAAGVWLARQRRPAVAAAR